MDEMVAKGASLSFCCLRAGAWDDKLEEELNNLMHWQLARSGVQQGSTAFTQIAQRITQ